jgi:DNA repair protein RecO (recombination protein O)
LNTFKKKVILLRKIKYGESDLILHAIAMDGEKLCFMARGALRSKKRFAGGVLEPTHFIEAIFNKPQEIGKLIPLSEVILINDFPKIRESYDRLDSAFLILNSVYRVSQEGEGQSQGLFNLLGNGLKLLETTSDLALLKLVFAIKFLYQQGVLQFEPWMRDYLQTPLSQLDELKRPVEYFEHKLDLWQRHLQQYTQTAETHL